MVTSKPGHKTTEFLLVLAVAVGSVAASAADWLPPRYAAIASAVSVAAYAVSRGLTKGGNVVTTPTGTTVVK